MLFRLISARGMKSNTATASKLNPVSDSILIKGTSLNPKPPLITLTSVTSPLSLTLKSSSAPLLSTISIVSVGLNPNPGFVMTTVSITGTTS